MNRDPIQRKLAEFLTPQGVLRAVGGAGEIWVGTNLGSVRKDNQDRVLAIQVRYANRPRDNFTLCVLADGIGGLSNGAEAAALAASTFASSAIRLVALPIERRLWSSAQEANVAVYEAFGGRSGATLSGVFVGESGAFGVNIGDSRIYGVTSERSVRQLSVDDTFQNYAKNAVGLAEQRNALIQFVGMGEGVEPHIIAGDTYRYSYFLLTSDGVHGVGDSLFGKIVSSAATPQDVIRRLVTLNDISGGTDNGSAAIVSNRQDREPGTDGTTIRAISPIDRLEIWIPVVVPQPDRREPSLHQIDHAREPQVKAKRKARILPRPKKTKTADATSPKLPLDGDDDKPEVKISFPDKGD